MVWWGDVLFCHVNAQGLNTEDVAPGGNERQHVDLHVLKREIENGYVPVLGFEAAEKTREKSHDRFHEWIQDTWHVSGPTGSTC